MKKIRFLAVVAALIIWAVPVHSGSAQLGIRLSNGSIASPIDALESELYSELVIDSFFDSAGGVYLLSGEVVKDLSLAKFSGEYDPATQQFSGDYLINFSPVVSEKGSEVYTLTGTFTGVLGAGGSVSLQLNGTIKYDKWNFETDEQGYPKYKDYLELTTTSGDSRQATFTVIGEAPGMGKPETGAEEEGLSPTEPTGLACQPQTHGLDPAKPGDVISPGAVYVDAAGKEVGIIQERWFLNGTNTTSITWDGQPVQVELQYTCLDHSGGSITYTIPAYQAPPGNPPSDSPASGSSQPGSQPDKAGGISPVGIAAIITAILGVVAAAGVGIGQVLKNGPKTPPPSAPPARAPLPPASAAPAQAARPPAANPPKAVPPPLQTPVQSAQPPAEPGSSEPSRSQPQRLTPEEKMRLRNIRAEMETEIDQIKNRWRQSREAVEKLKTLQKKNMLKFLTKKGFDVSEWVLTSPVEVINKVAVDPVMEEALGKHDTSQDGNIIVQMNNRIESLEGEMGQMAQEVRYLQTEINKINQTLGEPGG